MTSDTESTAPSPDTPVPDTPLPDTPVIVRREAGALTVELAAPERLNAVNTEMLAAMADAIEGAGAEDRVIVLRGQGRGFCAGADLAGNPGPDTIDQANRLVRALVAADQVVVAVVQGPCAGVGVSLALAADLVIASDAAFFQLAFTRVGLMPDGGASALVAASVGRAVAARMALLAERIGAQEALALGMVAAVVPPGKLDATVDRVVEQLRHGPAVAQAHAKQAINEASLQQLDPAFERELRGQSALLAAPDFLEGRAAFGERRAPVFADRVADSV